jgi:histidinol-phosphatase
VYEAELAFANELADGAAEIALHYFRGEFRIRLKKDRTPVTQADLEIEAMIRERIAERFPDDAVLGEEQGLAGSSERVWIVDPIDGTKNFAAGIQIWGNLIAFSEGDEPVVGVAGAPALGERYAAASGSGATWNGEAIRVSDVGRLSDSFVLFGDVTWQRDASLEERFGELARAAKRTRAFGDFWGHMLVARGAAEVMIEPELRTWDMAALKVIVQESGGRMTSMTGDAIEDHGSALTTNGRVHDEAVALLSEH